MKTTTPLQRGMACLCCRKRKMKCDGARPVCTQCLKSNRSSECQYYEKKHISRTELLQQKVFKLEARLRELESEQAEQLAGPSATPSTVPILGSAVNHSLSPESRQLDIIAFDTYSLPVNEWNQSFSHSHVSSTVEPSQFAPSLSEGVPSDVGWSSRFLNVSPSMDGSGGNIMSSQSSSDTDAFCDNKQMLLDIFFSHRHQCAFEVHKGRFQASLYSACAPKPHPALMDAIYLLACYFSRSPRFTELEAHFLKRALQGIADGLQCSDRVVNVLQASSLLAVYFFCHGRVLEGYYHSSIAARLAMDLGLHQVRSDDWFSLQISLAGSSRDGGSPPKASFPLSAPSDAIEYAERIAAFCQIFVVDRAWSVTTGLPAALQDGDHPRAQIETIWPVPMVEMPMDTGVSNMSSSLDDGFPRCSFSSSTLTLRAKAVMLFERTSRFSASSSYDREHWSEQRSLEMSLAQLSANIPHINRPNHFLLSDDDIDLVGIHTLIYAATIHLNRDFIETQPSSYEKCLISANSVTALVRNLSDNDYDFLDPINSACWRSVADVYIRILATPYMQALDTTMDIIEQQLNVLIAAMRRLSSVFPVAGIHASKTEQERLLTRDIVTFS